MSTGSVPKWCNINDKDVEMFSLKGICTDAKVVNVHDGDSVRLVFFMDGVPRKFACRLKGIDTPELRSRVPEEAVWAKRSKKALAERVDQQVVHAEFDENDKYGRPLVTLSDEKGCINEWLVDECYARPYFGDAKQSWA